MPSIKIIFNSLVFLIFFISFNSCAMVCRLNDVNGSKTDSVSLGKAITISDDAKVGDRIWSGEKKDVTVYCYVPKEDDPDGSGLPEHVYIWPYPAWAGTHNNQGFSFGLIFNGVDLGANLGQVALDKTGIQVSAVGEDKGVTTKVSYQPYIIRESGELTVVDTSLTLFQLDGKGNAQKGHSYSLTVNQINGLNVVSCNTSLASTSVSADNFLMKDALTGKVSIPSKITLDTTCNPELGSDVETITHHLSFSGNNESDYFKVNDDLGIKLSSEGSALSLNKENAISLGVNNGQPRELNISLLPFVHSYGDWFYSNKETDNTSISIKDSLTFN